MPLCPIAKNKRNQCRVVKGERARGLGTGEVMGAVRLGRSPYTVCTNRGAAEKYFSGEGYTVCVCVLLFNVRGRVHRHVPEGPGPDHRTGMLRYLSASCILQEKAPPYSRTGRRQYIRSPCGRPTYHDM